MLQDDQTNLLRSVDDISLTQTLVFIRRRRVTTTMIIITTKEAGEFSP